MRLVALLLVLPVLSGCMGFWDDLNRPDISVSRTALDQPNAQGYITSRLFSVQVLDAAGAQVVITATEAAGAVLQSEGHSQPGTSVDIELPDGVWDVRYSVAGHHWETFRNVKVDATPPSTAGLRTFAQDTNGEFTIGRDHQAEPGVTVEVRDAQGRLLGTTLPLKVTGLADGVHFFTVALRDAAGNQATHTVQVAAGQATALPQGQHTFGIVARYTNHARLWDLSDMGAYLTPAAARDATGQQWTGAGHGITPGDPVVVAAVQEAGVHGTTMQIAWSLFRWLLDELEYDDERLQSTTLMLPRQVIQDTEDPDAEADAGQDAGSDGLADDGPGNGVRGGVCRDLAATYVSLLRAAGVPARLVSGYLAGNVDGFHAWVEVYVGALGSQSPWLPVDVSPIDGRWNEPGDGEVPHGVQVAMTSFGIQLPQYLTLRQVPPDAETPGWSTALGTQYEFSGAAPRLDFAKELQDVGQALTGLLCFDPETLERLLRTRTSECQGMYIIGRDPQSDDPKFRESSPFVTGTQRVIDYGVAVESVSAGTTITMRLSHPFPADALPDQVEWAPYVTGSPPNGSRVHHEATEGGVVVGVLRR